MWPFKKTEKAKPESEVMKEYLETYEARIKVLIENSEKKTQKQTDDFQTDCRRTINVLERNLKDFFGIKSYKKSSNDPVLFTSNSFLADLLTQFKQLNYAVKKIQPNTKDLK